MKHRGLVIGGTRSGCGKTTITMGINRALRNRGLDIQPWKAGPDYIDPGFHTKAAGRICRNLDTMILEDRVVREIYNRQSCDLSIVEGVMGLFDGAGGRDERGSAAHLSKLLKLPVLLVMDVRSMARSAGAEAYGFAAFDPDVDLAGIILNRVGSERHYTMVKEAIEDKTGLPVLGAVPRDDAIHLPERHLGLVSPWEQEGFEASLEKLADLMEEHLDLDQLVELASRSGDLPETEMPLFTASPSVGKVKIALAQDRAFHFYYEDNLDLLRLAGADIHPFSPLDDPFLPEETHAVYIGGGYPELYARELADNSSLMEEIRQRCIEGMPLYGECGGFMYLTEGILDEEGSLFPLLGLLPGKSRLGKKVRALGYCEAVFNQDAVMGGAGETARGHVFHWSALEDLPEGGERALSVRKGDRTHQEGFVRDNVLGSWVHLHFASNPAMAAAFVGKAAAYRDQGILREKEEK